MSAEPSRPVRSTYYCHSHPERGWTEAPCDEPEHRHERFARFLRELMGLPRLREDEKGTP